MINLYSALIPLAILLPNLIFILFKPGNNTVSKKENMDSQTFLNTIEGLGRISVFVIPLFYSIQLNDTLDLLAFIGLLITLSFYYLGWIRYFHKKRKYLYLFKPLIKIPVPLAVSPVLYFIFASILLKSPLLFIGAVIFGIGHISLSLKQYNSL